MYIECETALSLVFDPEYGRFKILLSINWNLEEIKRGLKD